MVAWLNNKLVEMQRATRRLFNWETNRSCLTRNNDKMERSNSSTWRKACEEIENNPAWSRLQKILNKDPHKTLGNIIKPNGG